MDIFAEQQYIVERLDGDYAYLRNMDTKYAVESLWFFFV